MGWNHGRCVFMLRSDLPIRVCILGVSIACQAPPPKIPRMDSSADLVLRGGKIVTLDPARPTVSAVAIRDGNIVAVGETDTIVNWIGPQTRILELSGRT